MLIGYRVKEARKKKGLTQEQVGNELGVTKVSVSGYENGTRTPTLETFLDLIYLLELPVDYALGMETSVVNEEDVPYKKKISEIDFQILEEIKQHKKLYQQLCNNPKREVEKLSRK